MILALAVSFPSKTFFIQLEQGKIQDTINVLSEHCPTVTVTVSTEVDPALSGTALSKQFGRNYCDSVYDSFSF